MIDRGEGKENLCNVSSKKKEKKIQRKESSDFLVLFCL